MKTRFAVAFGWLAALLQAAPASAHTGHVPTANGLFVWAHRGLPLERAENTVASFRAALEAGADGLEMDVHTSADGVLVVIHDGQVDRTTYGAGDVASMPWSTIAKLQVREPAAIDNAAPPSAGPQATVPSLEEVAEAFPTQPLNIDLKAVSEQGVQAAFDVLRRYRVAGPARANVRVTSANTDTQRVIELCGRGEFARGMATHDVLDVLAHVHARRALPERLRGLAFQAPLYRLVPGLPRSVRIPITTARVVEALHAHGCQVHVWFDDDAMVDDLGAAKYAQQLGVDGVFTDDARTLCSERHERQSAAKAPC